MFVVGRTADIDDLSDASVRDISPVYEVEHLLRLEWDATDAAAVMVDGNTAKPEIWVATVDCKDADVQKLQTILRQRGIEGVVRLFPLTSNSARCKRQGPARAVAIPDAQCGGFEQILAITIIPRLPWTGKSATLSPPISALFAVA